MNDLSSTKINDILSKLGKNLLKYQDEILIANQKDIENAKNLHPESFIERLTISQKTFNSMLLSLESIISQESPLGKIIKEWDVSHNGLHIKRVSCPIGRILIIYESRPNVTLDAFALCFKSGNSCILRGGSESFETSSKIVEIIHKTLDEFNLSHTKHNIVQYVQTKERSAMIDFLKKNDEIDLVIPRGGKNLIQFVTQNTSIPILKHLDGNCHTYIENTANAQKAIQVLINAKLRRVSVCGATESLVLDSSFAKQYLSEIINLMPNCAFVGCPISCNIDSRIQEATNEDFLTEFSDYKLSVKIVENYKEAVEFINKHSSKHTEAILSENKDAVDYFFQNINSAIVLHNASTQFADGFEFGLGGEIGISTGKLHARGPVALEELTTYKNIVTCDSYQTRS